MSRGTSRRIQDEWKREALDAFERSGGAPVSIPVEYRAPGPPLEDGPNFQNRDWYLGVGAYQRVVSGEVSVVPGADGKPKINMDRSDPSRGEEENR
ncbi:hypothetical protein OG625_06635 [Streptomyces sp. NBC_01351]|uniref:hypothetical protein n=1 Tax=Streptomyces sp. NBC_01351 TaxID=2903833 RepID=UPI002E3649E5|nr:hypothetical protein [Streptomyces sp. NBC_01351]